MRKGSLILCLLFAGCASTENRERAAERRGYERGYAQAVKEQYWIIQNLQRRPAKPIEPTTP